MRDNYEATGIGLMDDAEEGAAFISHLYSLGDALVGAAHDGDETAMAGIVAHFADAGEELLAKRRRILDAARLVAAQLERARATQRRRRARVRAGAQASARR